MVVQQLNVATSYTSTPASGTRIYSTGLRDVILSVDGEIVTDIMENPAHGRRRDFILTTALAHMAQLPSHVGPLDAVRIASRAATLRPLQLIDRERVNSRGAILQPHYAIVGTRIAHNATVANLGVTTADVDYCDYSRDTSTFLCKAPNEYTAVEAAGAFAYGFSIEGDDIPASTMWAGIYARYRQMIRAGQLQVPSLPEMLQQAQAA